MKTAIVNLGPILSGDWRDPYEKGDAVLMAQGRIVSIGTASDLKDYDVVIDADGATAIPGFIDSQVHNTFGDWTPRQKTVGFLESYTHGGTTTAISASGPSGRSSVTCSTSDSTTSWKTNDWTSSVGSCPIRVPIGSPSITLRMFPARSAQRT
jgi:N-acyl-D-aspartate/D-glutamate deacylase